jgi:hypothetical protein
MHIAMAVDQLGTSAEEGPFAAYQVLTARG